MLTRIAKGILEGETAEKFDDVNEDNQNTRDRHNHCGPKDRDEAIEKFLHRSFGNSRSAGLENRQITFIKKFVSKDPDKRQIRRETVHFVPEFIGIVTADGFCGGCCQ